MFFFLLFSYFRDLFFKSDAYQLKFSFVGTIKRCARKSSLSCSESDLKNKFLKYKKCEKLTFEVSIWPKKLKFKFLKKIMLGPYVVNFFLILSKDAQRRVLQVGQNQNWKKKCKHEKFEEPRYICTSLQLPR